MCSLMVCSRLQRVQRQTRLASPREPEISRVSCEVLDSGQHGPNGMGCGTHSGVDADPVGVLLATR